MLSYSYQSFIINSLTPQGQQSPFFPTDQTSWLRTFTACNGKSQSPIDIVTREVTYDPSLPAIKLDSYDPSDDPEFTLQNNGHTCKSVDLFSFHLTVLMWNISCQSCVCPFCFFPLVQLQLPNTMRIIQGFDEIYFAAQLHFHWGNTEVPGSEHTIDNVHFPAEVWTANNIVYNIHSQYIFLWIKDYWRKKQHNGCLYSIKQCLHSLCWPWGHTAPQIYSAIKHSNITITMSYFSLLSRSMWFIITQNIAVSKKLQANQMDLLC